MNKKPSLAAALSKASGKEPPAPEPEAPANGEVPTTTRQGKRLIGGHFDPAVSKELKRLAVDKDTTVQALLSEALNDLFIKHNRKPIA